MPATEAWRNEVRRKAFHQLTLLYLPVYHLAGLAGVAVCFGVVAAADVARLRGWDGGFIQRTFGRMIRPKESARFTGSFYVALGVLVLAALFPPRLVTAGILALSLGDAASPLVGMRFGLLPYSVRGTRRSLDGTLAGYAVTLLIGLGCGFDWSVAAGAALVFTVVDTVPVPPDDNLWIPLAYASALRGLEAGLQ